MIRKIMEVIWKIIEALMSNTMIVIALMFIFFVLLLVAFFVYALKDREEIKKFLGFAKALIYLYVAYLSFESYLLFENSTGNEDSMKLSSAMFLLSLLESISNGMPLAIHSIEVIKGTEKHIDSNNNQKEKTN